MEGVPSGEKLDYVKGELAELPEEYRGPVETLVLEPELPSENPPVPGPLGFMRETVREVPAFRYAAGVSGVLSVVAMIGGFGVSYRVVLIGFPIALIFMILLLTFAKLADANPQFFLAPFLFLVWFSVIALATTVSLLITGVFFRWPQDLHEWLTGGSSARTGAR